MPKYKIDEILSSGIECEDGTQFEIYKTVTREYIVDEILVYAEKEEPEYYRCNDFNLLIEAIIRDHGNYTCLDTE